MCEFLFRGKEVADGKWIEGFYSAEEYNPYSGEVEHIPRIQIIGKCVSLGVIPETVGQYTGLTDKNGVRIFEGDIAEYEGKYYVVRYSEKYARFIFTRIGSEYAVFTVFDYERCEVIGNIHDNPELLKGGGDNG